MIITNVVTAVTVVILYPQRLNANMAKHYHTPRFVYETKGKDLVAWGPPRETKIIFLYRVILIGTRLTGTCNCNEKKKRKKINIHPEWCRPCAIFATLFVAYCSHVIHIYTQSDTAQYKLYFKNVYVILTVFNMIF